MDFPRHDDDDEDDEGRVKKEVSAAVTLILFP